MIPGQHEGGFKFEDIDASEHRNDHDEVDDAKEK